MESLWFPYGSAIVCYSCFVIVLLGAILVEKENIIPYFAEAGLITLILNVILMVVAFYIAQLLGTGSAQKNVLL